MRRRELRGQRILITGAARGIGRATALALASHGAELELADIDANGLDQVRAGCVEQGARRVAATTTDVTDESSVFRLAEGVHARAGALDGLVNAAGVAVFGPLLETDAELWHHLLEVNLWGTLRCVRAFAPEMLRRGRGQIINVASASAFLAPPGIGAYATTKYAVFGFSEALRFELAAGGVGVSVVCPGFVRTRITESLRFTESYSPARADTLRAEFATKGCPPDRVARAIVRALRSNPAVLPVTSEGWALYVLKRLTPGLLSWAVGRRTART